MIKMNKLNYIKEFRTFNKTLDIYNTLPKFNLLFAMPSLLEITIVSKYIHTLLKGQQLSATAAFIHQVACTDPPY